MNSNGVQRDQLKRHVAHLARRRQPDAIPELTGYLEHGDPAVVMQAAFGLLKFREDADVLEKLQLLRQHPDDMVRDVVEKGLAERKFVKPDVPHQESPDFLKNVVLHADALDAMQYMPDESVHLTFTSPPYYNARDYSVYSSYQGYMELLDEAFREVHRLTKEGRFLIVNTSPIIVQRVTRQHQSRRYAIPFDLHQRLVSDDRWEFIDDIVWVKPEAAASNRVAGLTAVNDIVQYSL